MLNVDFLADWCFGGRQAYPDHCYLVDEALAVGDTRFGRAFAERIERSGLILVSHSPALVRRLCTRAAVLDQGNLTFYDDLDEALATYNAL